MAHRMLLGFVALGAMSSVGCGSAESAADEQMTAQAGSLTEPAELVQERVLAEFDARGEHHVWLLWGDDADGVVTHRMQGPADRANSLSLLLEAAGEPLTTLETFLALAPAGLRPPAELVERQALETQALGRSEEVLTISVDKALTPPPGKQPCDPSLFYVVPSNPILWDSRINTGGVGNSFLCTSATNSSTLGTQLGEPSVNSCPFSSGHSMMVGACANSSAIVAYAGFGGATTWSKTADVNIPFNQYMVWTLTLDLTPHRLAAVGKSPGASYGLRAGTSSF